MIPNLPPQIPQTKPANVQFPAPLPPTPTPVEPGFNGEGFGKMYDELGNETFPGTAQEGYRPELKTAPRIQIPQQKSSSQDGHKKQILNKLIENLLGKPGRSMHELINGIKAAIGAYKNYAKEWDNLAGQGLKAVVDPIGASAGGIQKILQSIQQKKAPQDGGGGPGMPMGLTQASAMGQQQRSPQALEALQRIQRERMLRPSIQPNKMTPPITVPTKPTVQPLPYSPDMTRQPMPYPIPQYRPMPIKQPIQPAVMPSYGYQPMPIKQPIQPAVMPPKEQIYDWVKQPAVQPSVMPEQYKVPPPVSNLGIWGY